MKVSTDAKFFLLSISLHLGLILVMTVKVFVFPDIRPEHTRSVRVDFVALPDKDPTEAPQGSPQPAAPPPPAKKAPTPKPEAVVVDKTQGPKKTKTAEPEAPSTKDQQASALKRLQALSKIKKMKESQQKSEAGPEGAKYAGNQISEGTSLTGVDKLQHDQYLEKLDQHIKSRWQLPEWLAQKSFTAALLVKFDENGQLLDKRIIKSSGNRAFDDEAMRAVEASAPLPAPPENLISYFKVRGIELRFPE